MPLLFINGGLCQNDKRNKNENSMQENRYKIKE